MSFAPRDDDEYECEETSKIIGYQNAPLTLGEEMHLNADAMAHQYELMQQARCAAQTQEMFEHQQFMQMQQQQQQQQYHQAQMRAPYGYGGGHVGYQGAPYGAGVPPVVNGLGYPVSGGGGFFQQ